jgi:hypothetical protein
MPIKIQYDAQYRILKLVDSHHQTIVEGDALYDLALPLMFENIDENLLASLPIVASADERFPKAVLGNDGSDKGECTMVGEFCR